MLDRRSSQRTSHGIHRCHIRQIVRQAFSSGPSNPLYSLAQLSLIAQRGKG